MIRGGLINTGFNRAGFAFLRGRICGIDNFHDDRTFRRRFCWFCKPFCNFLLHGNFQRFRKRGVDLHIFGADGGEIDEGSDVKELLKLPQFPKPQRTFQPYKFPFGGSVFPGF